MAKRNGNKKAKKAPTNATTSGTPDPGKRRYLKDKLLRAAKRDGARPAELLDFIDKLWSAGAAEHLAARYFHLLKYLPERAIDELSASARAHQGRLDEATLSAMSDIVLSLQPGQLDALASSGCMPEDWPEQAAQVRRAAELITAGKDAEAGEALRALGLRSPFKHVRLFLRGQSALSSNDQLQAQRAFAALPPSCHLKAVAERMEGLLAVDVAPIKNALSDGKPSRAVMAAAALAGKLEPVPQKALARDLVSALIRIGLDPESAVNRVRRAMPSTMGPLLADLLTALGAEHYDRPGKPNAKDTATLWKRVEARLERNGANDGAGGLREVLGVPGPDGVRIAVAWTHARRAEALHREASDLEAEADELREEAPNLLGGCTCPACMAELEVSPRGRYDLEDLAEFDRLKRVADAQEARADKLAAQRLEILWQVTRLDPGEPQHWRTLIDTLSRAEDEKGEARAIEEMAKALPEHPEALITAARAAVTRQAWDKALRYVKKAQELEPLSRSAADLFAEVLCGKARKKLAQKKPQEAVRLYETATALPHRTLESLASVAGEVVAALHAEGLAEQAKATWMEAERQGVVSWLLSAHALLSAERVGAQSRSAQPGPPGKKKQHRRKHSGSRFVPPPWWTQTAPMAQKQSARSLDEQQMTTLVELVRERLARGGQPVHKALSELLAHAVMADGHLHLKTRAILTSCLNALRGHDEAQLRVAEHGQQQHPQHAPFFIARYQAAMDLKRPADYFFDFAPSYANLSLQAEPGQIELDEFKGEIANSAGDPASVLESIMERLNSRGDESRQLKKLYRAVSAYLKAQSPQNTAGRKAAQTQLQLPTP